MIDDERIHETPEDRERQFQILTAFCAATGYRFIQTHILWPYDAWVWRRGPYLCAEVKYRTNAYGAYRDLTIDKKKLVAIMPDGVLIISWAGDIRYARIRSLPQLEDWQQRHKGGRIENPDLVSHVPLEEFKKI